MKEISTSSAAGGGAGDGSAGPVKTPYAFGKVKDPTTGLDGYKQVGKKETGTLSEKKKKDASDDAPKKSSKGTPYTPEVLPAEKRLKALQHAADAADKAAKQASDAAATVNQLAKARKKAMQHKQDGNGNA